jgi:hypothetical protein
MVPPADAELISIVPVERIDLRFTPRPWEFATEGRAEIDRYFVEQQKLKPGMWNGRALLLRDHAVANGVFRGEFFETDYAAFYAHCQWGFPDPAVKNGFAAGALRAADGGFVLGEMGRHTANAGNIYFPCGTPDPSDVVGGRVDFDASIRREIGEELGLGDEDYVATSGWTVIFTGTRVALIKLLRAHEPADVLSARIRDYLAREHEPELAGIHIVRTRAELGPRMPSFVGAYLNHIWEHHDGEAEQPG